MRIRHSLKAFVPFILMLAAGRSVQAQYGPPVPSAGMPPGGVPAGYNAYQGQSAYQNMFEQNYNSDGLWFRNSNNGIGPYSSPRDYFFNLDYTRTKTRDMRGVFGHAGAQSYHQQNDPENDEIIEDLQYYNYFSAAHANMIPSLFNSGIRASGGFWQADGTGLLMDVSWGSDGSAVFDGRQNALSNRLDTATILNLRSTGGTGLQQGFNLNGQTDLGITVDQILAPGKVFDDGDNDNYGFFGDTSDVLDRTLLNLYGIPIGDVKPNQPTALDPEGGNGRGITVPFDIQFLMEHSISTIGSTIDLAMTPIYERNGLKVNPVFGGRILRIDEAFRFRGIDSGLAYGAGDNDTPDNAKVVTVPNGVDDDDDFVTDNPGEEGALQLVGINPSETSLVRAFLNSEVVSNMAGPEFGLNYSIGERKGFSVVGSTKVAAMFNNEKVRVKGDNIFNFMNTLDPTDPESPLEDGFDTSNLNGPSQNAFANSESSNHLSPLLEQTLAGEIPIFQNVPVLNRVEILEDAKLRLGWTFLLIGEVADPNQSVDYSKVNPQLGFFPQARNERDTFIQNTFSVGINWNY